MWAVYNAVALCKYLDVCLLVKTGLAVLFADIGETLLARHEMKPRDCFRVHSHGLCVWINLKTELREGERRESTCSGVLLERDLAFFVDVDCCVLGACATRRTTTLMSERDYLSMRESLLIPMMNLIHAGIPPETAMSRPVRKTPDSSST